MEVILHADDLGRTKGVNDGIFDAVDNGAVSSVSILVNGDGYADALARIKDRPHLAVALHFNLTEGRALDSSVVDSALADSEGYFIHSPASLACLYYLSGKNTKKRLRALIRREFMSQLEQFLKDRGNTTRVRIDSHNHVHMLPFVMDEITEVLKGYDTETVRLVREPLYLSGAPLTFKTVLHDTKGYMRIFLMNTLARRVRRILEKKHIPFTASFAGLFATGRMNIAVLQNALAAQSSSVPHIEKHMGALEILFHPGGGAHGEETLWRENERVFRDWYFAEGRASERSALTAPALLSLLEQYRSGRYTPTTFSEKVSAHLGQVFRFGVTGTLAAAVHLSGLYFFTEWVGVWYVASSALGFALGFIVSFSLQKFWTFENYETDGMHGQVFKYFLLQMFGLSANLVGIYVLVDVLGMYYLLAQVVVLLLVAVVVFLVSKFAIFAPRTLPQSA